MFGDMLKRDRVRWGTTNREVCPKRRLSERFPEAFIDAACDIWRDLLRRGVISSTWDRWV
jgi:hypothetical protein